MRDCIILALILMLLLPAGLGLAQTLPSFDLGWHVIDGGGTRVQSVSHTLWGTVGQFASGPMASADHTLCAGFWCLPSAYRIYLPLVLRGS